MHCEVGSEILPSNEFYETNYNPPVWEVNPLLFGVYCSKTSTYSIVKKPAPGKKQFKCLICIFRNTKCSHVERLRLFLNEPRENNENLQEFGFEENEPRNNDEYLQEAKCKSSEKKSYPLQGDDITKFKYHLSGNPYPTKLIPKFNSSTKCKHENSFDSASPVSKGWVSTD